jgi:hypothetical protein
VEVYQEKLIDLFGPKSNNIKVQTMLSKDGFEVTGMETKEIKEIEQIKSLLKKSQQNRKTSPTSANKNSSRSHTILTVKIESQHTIIPEMKGLPSTSHY